MKRSGNTILVTGGGSGIGEALAYRLHDAGNAVIVAGRRREALESAIAGRSAMSAMTLDIDDAAAIDAFAAQAVAEHPELNVLINNAGIMRSERLDARRDLQDAEATVTTNLLGPIRLTNALIDHLIGRPDAVIANVTSGLAFVPLVATPTYSATKAALHSYTVSLRHALKGRVEVVEIAPPGVRTDLQPGQAQVEAFQPLDEYADEAVGLLLADPTPPEVLVERVGFLRGAEGRGQFDEVLGQLNAPRG